MDDNVNEQAEFAVIQELKGMVFRVREVRETGKRIILCLVEHSKLKHVDYLKTKDQKDLQVTLDFLGIRVLVKVVIALSSSPDGGKIVAFLLPERVENEPKPLDVSFPFDKLGNINQHHTVSEFPIHFVKKLADEFAKRKLPVS